MDKKTRNAILKIIALFIFLFIFGAFTSIGHLLFPVAKQYQHAYNDKRKILGILPLPGDWKTAGKNEETKS